MSKRKPGTPTEVIYQLFAPPQTPERVFKVADGRTFRIPAGEHAVSGDPVRHVLNLEAATDVRLKDGGNPAWFLLLHRQFRKEFVGSGAVSFREYVRRRHADKIVAAEPRTSEQPSTPEGTAPPYSVHESGDTVEVNGKQLRLHGQNAGPFLRLLLDKRGCAVKAAYIANTLGERPDRIFKKLPKAVQKQIDKPGPGVAGYMLR